MNKLPEVEDARALMTEAMSWSVMKWLREKKRVRKVADKANAALDELHCTVKSQWNHEIVSAYNELVHNAVSTTEKPQPKPQGQSVAAETMEFVRQVKEAEDQAHRARMEAERTFDEAERLLSTSLAREGCRKAIRSWDLHEKSIRTAES